ncbi:hypothetical protein VA7868_04278 [Vibrio aerogenes CECT 7868]|uniref:Uncharacterized protein n=1 Tax=Vibrio aerogenes CECT 7868 TaxID=1216006 RepID=A0A1M6DP31_9VIBR|nr:hypothetical protein VA7868_04278 [Vibrio aerogenes CECT 7868]
MLQEFMMNLKYTHAHMTTSSLMSSWWRITLFLRRAAFRSDPIEKPAICGLFCFMG